MSSQVFISYSSKSKDEMVLLRNYLKDHGITSVWLDEDKINPGAYISEHIKEGVQDSGCCIILLNKYSRDSKWCMAEVGAFWGASKPVIIYPIRPHCKVPSFLAGIRLAHNPADVVKACLTIPPSSSQVAPILESLRLSSLTNAFRIRVEDHQRERRVKELVDEECNKLEPRQFRLLASSGFNYLHPNGKVRQAGLGRAITHLRIGFSIVLESPFSQFALTRALANQVKHDHWTEKVLLLELEKLNEYDTVSIRVTDHPVNCSLFFTSNAVFYDPYLWALPFDGERTENNFWVFEFRKADREEYDCYSLLEKHFAFLEAKSLPLRDFLGDGGERYNKLAREFSRKLED